MEDENNSLLITEVANLCDDEQLVEETVKESSLLIAGGFSLLGGLIAGPFGSAIGGTLGAALMKDTRRKLKSAQAVILRVMSDFQRHELVAWILQAVSGYVTGLSGLLEMLHINLTIQKMVLQAVVLFISVKMASHLGG